MTIIHHRRRWLSCALATSLLAAAGAAPAAAATAPADRASWADSEWGDDDTREGYKSTLIAGSWVPQHDQGSMYSITKETGAQDVWGKSDPRNGSRKLTGHGVGVAVIDTGIAPVEGLLTPGKLVNGPDLSFESQVANTRYLDGYGHGTHMAGIIAGRDSAVVPGNEKDDKYFVGMAPDAKIVNMKVGAADGGADVTQVIAAVDWVVANRASNNIRVINLSYGLDSTQSPSVDPLAHAVENAWRAGIVVVAAAGNDGESGATTLTNPAVDPFVIAVGSSDHNGQDNLAATTIGRWTNDGTAQRRPDLLAPGKSVVSLRVPGSLAAVEHPEGQVYGDPTKRMFRGTGTSQSAAVVSGAAALLLQRNPELTPDQVKGLLKASADKLSTSDPTQGAGQLDVKGAVELLEKGAKGAAVQQTFPASTGLGTLEASRGGSNVVDPDNGVVLTGEKDIFGVPWNAPVWAQASFQRRSWAGGTWNGSTWTGAAWSGSSWAGASWSRRSWAGVDWSRRSWASDQFLRRSWASTDFSRRSWAADSFLRRSWASGDWYLTRVW